MTTFLLVLTLFNTGVETGQNVHAVVHALKAVHHHTTLPLYHHVLKPVGKAVSE